MSNLIISKFPRRSNMENKPSFVDFLIAEGCALMIVGLCMIYMFVLHPFTDDPLPDLNATPIPTETEIQNLVEESQEIVNDLVKETPEEQVIEEPEKPKAPILSDEELIAMVVHAEAGNQDMLGKTLVAAVVFNRCDYWGLTVESVVYADKQFAIAESYTEQDLRAVEIAQENRDLFPDNLLYFRAGDYHNFGEKWEHIGDHYFSLAEEKEN